jgi:Ni/Fe-hydrogenase 1 B-type cytochrome subunit
MGDVYYEIVQARTKTVIVIHWLVALSTVVLVFTGLYIANPFLIFGQGEAYQTFMMAKVRFIHFAAAIVLDISFLVRLYLAFFSTFKCDACEVLPTPRNFKEAFEQIKYFWTFKGQDKEFHIVEPLDGLLFFGLHLVLVLQLFTGFAIYVSGIDLYTNGLWYVWAAFLHILTDWTLYVFGGLSGVRLVHHFTTWLIITGAFIHIYIQIWKTVKLKRGHITSIIGGYKLVAKKEKKPTG